VPKLMPGIGQRDRLCAVGYPVAGENCDTMLARERIRIESQFPGQFHIDFHDARCRYRCWVQTCVEVLRKPRKSVVECETHLPAGKSRAERRIVEGNAGRIHRLLDVSVLVWSRSRSAPTTSPPQTSARGALSIRH
jgi:hypothetical protein